MQLLQHQRPGPLEIPEILARVSFFVRVWERQRNDHYHARIIFSPRDALSCIQVSRLWRLTFTPLLWQVYVDALTTMPRRALVRNSRHLKVLELPDMPNVSFVCTNLTKLQLDNYNDKAVTLEEQKKLVRANMHLKTLSWSSSGMSSIDLDPEDFLRLRGLEVLQLANWNGGGGAFLRVIRAVSQTLITLDLYRVYDNDNKNYADLSLPNFQHLRLSSCSTNLYSCAPNFTSLELSRAFGSMENVQQAIDTLPTRCPRLRSIKVAWGDKNEGLLELLLRKCTLAGIAAGVEQSAAGAGPQSGSSFGLSSWLGPTITKMTAAPLVTSTPALVPRTTPPRASTSATLPAILTSASATSVTLPTTTLAEVSIPVERLGLETISIRKGIMGRALVKSILVHSQTLRDLTLFNLGRTNSHGLKTLLPEVAQILAYCYNLRRFSFTVANVKVSSREMFEGLRSQPWNCMQLEYLEVMFYFSEDNLEEDYSYYYDEEECSSVIGFYGSNDGDGGGDDGEEEDDCSYMGWYLHPGLATPRHRPQINLSIQTDLFRQLEHLSRLRVFAWAGSYYSRSRMAPDLTLPDSLWIF
ncbi:hypothetical protein BGZ95_004256 [Linnemannia exigua]|uniref:F-box domain-containing protein n=1 Tax=Linnemannia exigua TaxID=604196 RepID=A0AAD4D368_9FUNG|nr:hypothetical protein BGZ95_004256 [Linnemannia exigua]